MGFLELISIEFKKTKRSKILILLAIAPLLVVGSGVGSISAYFTEDYTGAWQAMFVQSGLLLGYFLLPFSMVVLCVLLSQLELRNNGIMKMLALPVSRVKMATSKFIVLLGYLGIQLFIYFVIFVIAGVYATHITMVSEVIPVIYILKWSVILMLSAIPAVSIMWMITCLIEKPILSMGLNLLFIIPAILIANTPLWSIYPFCYSGVMISAEMNRLRNGMSGLDFNLFSLLLYAIPILIISMAITTWCFGKKEMK